jgi:hypothetical protein
MIDNLPAIMLLEVQIKNFMKHLMLQIGLIN